MFISRRAIVQAGLLLPALVAIPGRLAALPTRGFTHCVASGDPDTSSVRLWTRFVGAGEVNSLRLEVSETEDFRSLIAQGEAIASAATDYCAQLRVSDLKPGRFYYYRFLAPTGDVSPVGRTRTLAAGHIDRCRIAVMSCGNATSGWFNAYAHAAARDDLDLVVHLGDYIYESPVDRPDALEELATLRGIAPLGEAVSLLDYRLRYASYRSDPALQELHRRHPMVVIWDDHETANNSWQHGASAHDLDEGPWEVRKAAGMRAFHEWLPMDPRPYSDYRIGDLATLFRLETRLLARSEQLDIETALAGGGEIAPAVARFLGGPLAAPSRTMMGPEQEAWLADGLHQSVGDQTRWQVLLQQVIMAPTRLPAITPAWFAPGTELTIEEQRELAAANLLSSAGVPFGLDRWDGYPAARDRLLASAKRAEADLIVLSGDSHNAWAYELAHEHRPVGVEFAVQGVSSLGLEKRFGGDPQVIAGDFLAQNDNLRWCETSQRGYMQLDLAHGSATSTWHFLPSRNERSIELLASHSVTVEHGARGLT